jgi:hypothetical protein
MRLRPLLLVITAVLIVMLAASAGMRWWLSRPAVSQERSLERIGDYGTVPDFALTERSGRRVTRDDPRGFVWAAEIYCLAQQGFHLAAVDPAESSPPACGRAVRFGPVAAWASHGSQAPSLATLTENVRTLLAEKRSAARGGDDS